MATPEIRPRDIDFLIDPNRIADWNGGFTASVVWNALSIMFPHGERYFIRSVAAFAGRVTEPELDRAVRGFIAQEALHTREHIAYNQALRRIVDADALERAVDDRLSWAWRRLPPVANLAATCALEHFTAIIARDVLANPAYLRAADPTYARLWTWHALEECEHKSVAFDVFRCVTRDRGYWLRVRMMALATSTFLGFVGRNVVALLHASGRSRSPKAWAGLLWYLFGSPGVVTRTVMPYVRYYAPGFRPANIDDRSVVDRVRRDVEAWT